MLKASSLILFILFIALLSAEKFHYQNVKVGSEWTYAYTSNDYINPLKYDTVQITLDSAYNNEALYFTIETKDSIRVDSIILKNNEVNSSLLLKKFPLFFECDTNDTINKNYFSWDESLQYHERDTSIYLAQYHYENKDYNQLKYRIEQIYTKYDAHYISEVGLLYARSDYYHHATDHIQTLTLIKTNTISEDLLSNLNGISSVIKKSSYEKQSNKVSLFQIISDQTTFAFNVYTIKGQLIPFDKRAEELSTLPKGVYILKGTNVNFSIKYKSK